MGVGVRAGQECFGGPEGIRTLDLFHAMEARSQLRHRPTHERLPSREYHSVVPEVPRSPANQSTSKFTSQKY
jgi:hypothetical protein